MKPLGISIWQLTTARPMAVAGGRLFVDVAPLLASPATQKTVIDTLGQSHPLIKDALMTLLRRGDFRTYSADEKNAPVQIENDPAIVDGLIKDSQASIEATKKAIQTKAGLELFDFILEDIQHLKKILFGAPGISVIMAGMNASKWINEKMNEWLGEKNAADTLLMSVPNNVTAEMGLALMDVADVIRPYPEVIACLQEGNLHKLDTLKGGREAQKAIEVYLSKYGMRCAGEIDITRTRWSEDPSALITVLLGNIKNFGPKAAARKFEEGRQQAQKKEQALLARLEQLPAGQQKAEEAKQTISLLRNFTGYREYPKYGMIARYFVYKQALLKEAEKLTREKEDLYYLTFEEFREAVRTKRLDHQLISRRKAEYEQYEKLTPPRVMTSDGEIITGKYNRENIPASAMAGQPVSSGIVEGRARVILRMEDAELEDGDILVTVFTDPSWTPLFVSIKGLVTEVGGLMTHGAVIAREYGIPAVVGVENATKLIRDGQRIRVHGTDGYIDLL